MLTCSRCASPPAEVRHRWQSNRSHWGQIHFGGTAEIGGGQRWGHQIGAKGEGTEIGLVTAPGNQKSGLGSNDVLGTPDIRAATPRELVSFVVAVGGSLHPKIFAIIWMKFNENKWLGKFGLKYLNKFQLVWWIKKLWLKKIIFVPFVSQQRPDQWRDLFEPQGTRFDGDKDASMLGGVNITPRSSVDSDIDGSWRSSEDSDIDISRRSSKDSDIRIWGSPGFQIGLELPRTDGGSCKMVTGGGEGTVSSSSSENSSSDGFGTGAGFFRIERKVDDVARVIVGDDGGGGGGNDSSMTSQIRTRRSDRFWI